LVLDIKFQFGVLRSKNKIKNFWYSRKKHLSRLAKAKKRAGPPSSSGSSIQTTPLSLIPPPIIEPNFQFDPQFKVPDKMKPFF